MQQQDYDVLIIGAGLSGIGAAVHLSKQCPGLRVAILERRHSVGGTWDLFRYPGIRSDSDMFSFGFEFRPWDELKVLADGPAIRQYVRDTAQEYGIDKNIQFGLKITRAAWSSAQGQWTLTALQEASGETRAYRCRFLISCTGYYNYDQGYQPEFPGVANYQGQLIHPQRWPDDLDYRGKRVVVIGSGATAVTVVPAMADEVAHITLLQRSPTYIFSVPGYDKITELLRRVLPRRWAFNFARRRNIALQRWMYKLSKRYPNAARKLLLSNVRKRIGDAADMRHFTPKYQPWDERLCAVPDGDLFRAITSGKASIVTDQIDSFTAHGIRLKSGQQLDADIIVSATGLQLQIFGGAEIVVDERVRPLSELMTYKGVLVQDIPNMAWVFGYTNAPWTLKADLAARYVCRLLNHMQEHGYGVATPRAPSDAALPAETILDALGSGYIQRSRSMLPRQGKTLPWRVMHHYERDKPMLLRQPIADPALEFSAAPPATARAAA